MIITCEAYAYEFGILFNPRKSKRMCFNVNVENLDITFCVQKLIYVNIKTYFDVSRNSDIMDRAITQTVCSFYQTRCTRGDARSFFCTYKTYLYAQNYFRKNKFKYCFKSYVKLHEYANCNSANYDV